MKMLITRNTTERRHLSRCLLGLLIVLSGLLSSAGSASATKPGAPALAPSPQYNIRIQAIRTANDNGSEETVISAAQVKQWVDKTNAALGAANAGIKLVYDQNLDGPILLKNSKINHIYYGDPNTVEANSVADQYPGKLVFFFRWAAGSGANQNRGNGFADINTHFIAMPAFDQTGVIGNNEQYTQNIWQMAHDFGHYLDLDHTFPGSSDGDTDTPDKAAKYIRNNGGTQSALDGDGIADTGPEAGTSFYISQGWKLCSEHNSYTISGTKTNGQQFSYTFYPQRNNIMSYFACEPMGFTAGQVAKMRQNLLVAQRKHLYTQPCFPDFHGLPAGQFQNCFNYWVNRGLWPITLSQYTAGGTTYMAGSFQTGTNRPVYVNITEADFAQKFETFKKGGFRPGQISVLSTNSGPRYTVLWTPLDGEFYTYVGMTPEQYQTRWTQMHNNGFVHVDLAVYRSNGVKFVSTWVKRTTNGYLTRHGLTSAQYSQLVDEYWPQGFRPTRLTPYVDNGQRRYAVIMEKLAGNWAHYRDMTPATYQQRYTEFASKGLRLIHLSVLDNVFSAIWMKP